MEYPINTKASSLKEHSRILHDKIANLSYGYNWTELLDVLEENKSKINCCRLSGEGSSPKLFTPLHQAAYGSAPFAVIQKLIDLGASKTLKTNERKETAYDIAKRCNASQDVLDTLKVPNNTVGLNEQQIRKMEKGLHDTILGRAKDLVEKHQLQLPQLVFLYEFGDFWFPVPGMYGGFHVEKCEEGIQTSSWCRVAGGSGQRHVIDKEGNVKLTDQGFV